MHFTESKGSGINIHNKQSWTATYTTQRLKFISFHSNNIGPSSLVGETLEAMQQTSAESLNPAIRIRTQNRIKSLCYTPRKVTCSSDFNIAARKLDTGYFLHLTSTGYNVVIIALLESENSSL